MTSHIPKTNILMIKDIAESLKVTAWTIYRLATTKISALKVGGSFRFSKADIDRGIAAQTAAPLAAVLDPERPVGGTP